MNGHVFHQAAGLILSADRPIPGLPSSAAQPPADIRVHAGRAPSWRGEDDDPFYASSCTDLHGVPNLVATRGPHGFHFKYADGTDVWLAADAGEIWCTWAASATFEDTSTYLTGPVLGFALRLRGGLALHASAVCLEAGAVALIGPHGAGKSTTAAALARRGHPIVTDDVLHLSRAGGGWIAHPFAAHVRLWPDGAALALGAAVELPRLTPTWDKRVLIVGAAGTHGTRAAVALAGLVLLDPIDHGAGEPCLRNIRPAEALVRLAANSSSAQLLTSDMRAQEFDALGSLLSSVPCVCAAASSARGTLEQLLDLVEEWSAAHLGHRGG